MDYDRKILSNRVYTHLVVLDAVTVRAKIKGLFSGYPSKSGVLLASMATSPIDKQGPPIALELK